MDKTSTELVNWATHALCSRKMGIDKSQKP